jgi:tRNA(adenine34) deaminase
MLRRTFPMLRRQPGGVRERPNRHDWKSCDLQGSMGSNPISSARPTRSPDRQDVQTYSVKVRGVTDIEASSGDAGGLSYESAMGLAIVEARSAVLHGDVPVGAVVFVGDRIVAKAHNERELRADPTAHAEILAIREAANVLGTWRLEAATLAVTLEPCAMCAGALVASRMGKVAFGAVDPKAGACGSLYNMCSDPRLNHELPVIGGVLAEECGAVLTEFFAGLRGHV